MITKLNQIQEQIVDEFINCGGIGHIIQPFRGEGYTTGIVYLAVNQLLQSRDVLLVVDTKTWWLHHVIYDVAKGMFDADVKIVKNTDTVYFGDNRLTIINIKGNPYRLRGKRFDDVFIDCNGDILSDDRCKEMFMNINACRRPTATDGSGFYFASYW